MVRRCSTDTRSRFFSVRVVSRWNSLPEQVVAAGSVAAFKRLLADFLGQELYDGVGCKLLYCSVVCY